MLRLARLEMRKVRKRYGNVSLAALTITILFSACLGYLAMSTGVTSDVGLYSSNVYVNSTLFTTSQNPDIVIVGDGVFVHNSDKSLAAADEFRNVVMSEYRKEIERNYGDKAYPLLVSVRYIKVEQIKVERIAGREEISEYTSGNVTGTETEKTVKIATTATTTPGVAEGKSNETYIPPEDLKTPGLVDRMATAFIFVIPAYFTVQVFSSSLLEDKTLRRLEVLLSIVSRGEVLAGKALPYLAISIVFAMAVAILFGDPPSFVFVLPVVFLMFSAHSFVVVIARSYREATFLLLAASLLITIYAFIPAIFSTALPFSRISPITLLLAHLNGDVIDPLDALLSFGHFGVMTGLLLYMSARGLNLDILHGKSITGKIVEISKRGIGGDVSAFVFAFLSISFAFMAELFALLTLFVLPYSLLIPTLLVSVALVEEVIKGSIILSKPDEKRAIATAVGFFAGEKFLIVFNVLRQYSIVFLGKYLLLPLILHLVTAEIFVLAYRRWGIPKALTATIALHAAYDYTVVMLLA